MAHGFCEKDKDEKVICETFWGMYGWCFCNLVSPIILDQQMQFSDMLRRTTVCVVKGKSNIVDKEVMCGIEAASF